MFREHKEFKVIQVYRGPKDHKVYKEHKVFKVFKVIQVYRGPKDHKVYKVLKGY